MTESGILIVDKPEGISSAKLVARVKKLLGAAKAGHAGTLDPFATGVMICCINQATRLSRFFLHGNKTYKAVICLGIETDTQDLTGNIISQTDIRDMKIEAETVRSVCRQFEGSIEQMPPVYSALKHEGVPLYRLARKGKPVQKPARQCFISSLEITDINLPEIRITVSCSAGTYIRSLAADIGKALGCGGHLKALRRVESGGFTIQQAVKLEDLESGAGMTKMTEMADALNGMPCHAADAVLMKKIKYGIAISKKELPPSFRSAEMSEANFSLSRSAEMSEANFSCRTGLSVLSRAVLLLKTPEPERFIKIVDENHRLLAVLCDKTDGDTYNYCCVFQENT
ncbi:MAG: tRNA pseudouridine(55) synthase TruB [Desulfobacteraceae bacterium IS3]|nr:MAG: tRNA pseudouridine(55) synthase TruB [Desulfobacteraceae bacterium IS3]